MKKIIFSTIVSITLVATSCQTESEKLQAEKADFETQLLEAKKGLKEVNEKLIELDSVQEESFAAITTVKTENKLFEHSFEIQGAIAADKNVIVVPEAGGLIKTLSVQEGQTINKGAVIATFDAKVIASNMKELEEQIDLAKYLFEKQTSLFEQGVGTELAVKQTEAQYKTLQQTLTSLKTQKGKFVLTAPFTGYVEQVFPVVGEMAGPTSPIIRLIDLKNLSVKADISEAYLAKLNRDNNLATLRFPALGNSEIKDLPIKRVGKFINPVNRTVGVEVKIPNPGKNHVPNLMAVLKIRDYVDSNALVIPSRIILRDINQEPFVFVVKDNIVQERKITLGQSSRDDTEILNGLKPGEMLVDGGCRGVKNNQKVEVRN